MKDLLLKLVGWKATILHGDPCVYDRWNWLRRHLKSGPLRTLDAGCGSGAFTMYASRIGNHSVGLSFDEANNKNAQRRATILGIVNIEFIQTDLRRIDLLTDRLDVFDQIICFETIEHILEDKELLRNLSNLLKCGGRLLLTSPFSHCRPLLGDHVSETEDGGHVRWGYTHEELNAMFNECGLDVVEKEYISGFISQQLTNFTRIIGRVNPYLAWVVILPLRLFQVFDRPVTKLLTYPYLSVSVIGVKRYPFKPIAEDVRADVT